MALINALKKISPSLLFVAATLAPAAAQTAPNATRTAPAQTTASAPAQSQPDPSRECGCEAGALPEVLAAVGDVRVTQTDISPEVRKRVADLQQQVVEARRRELDLQINTVLLEAEAKRRGV